MNGLGEARLRKINELKTEMDDWVAGRKSWTNLIRGQSTTQDNAYETVLIAQADAAEVQKISAAIQAEAVLAQALGWSS